MPPGNPSPKLAITAAPAVRGLVLAVAASEGISVSAWMTRSPTEFTVSAVYDTAVLVGAERGDSVFRRRGHAADTELHSLGFRETNI